MNVPHRTRRSLSKALRYVISIPERCINFGIRPGGNTYNQLYKENA